MVRPPRAYQKRPSHACAGDVEVTQAKGADEYTDVRTFDVLDKGIAPSARWPIAQQMWFGFVTVTAPGHADDALPDGTAIGHDAPFAGTAPACS